MFAFSFKYLIKKLVFPALRTDQTHGLFAQLEVVSGREAAVSLPGSARDGKRYRERTDSLGLVCTQVASL